MTHDAFSIAIRGTSVFPPRSRPAVPRAWTARFLADTAGLAIDAIPVDRFHLYRSRKLDGATEHSVEASFPPGS